MPAAQGIAAVAEEAAEEAAVAEAEVSPNLRMMAEAVDL